MWQDGALTNQFLVKVQPESVPVSVPDDSTHHLQHKMLEKHHETQYRAQLLTYTDWHHAIYASTNPILSK